MGGGLRLARRQHLEKALQLVKVELDLRLLLGPHSSLLRRSDLVPVQLLQAPRLDLQQSPELSHAQAHAGGRFGQCVMQALCRRAPQNKPCMAGLCTGIFPLLLSLGSNEPG